MYNCIKGHQMSNIDHT